MYDIYSPGGKVLFPDPHLSPQRQLATSNEIEQHVVGLTVNIPHLFLNGLKVIVAPTEEAVLRIRVRHLAGEKVQII